MRLSEPLEVCHQALNGLWVLTRQHSSLTHGPLLVSCTRLEPNVIRRSQTHLLSTRLRPSRKLFTSCQGLQADCFESELLRALSDFVKPNSIKTCQAQSLESRSRTIDASSRLSIVGIVPGARSNCCPKHQGLWHQKESQRNVKVLSMAEVCTGKTVVRILEVDKNLSLQVIQSAKA